jgi:hypothetical protein
MDQCVVNWTGFPGAPGYSVFYALPGGSFADAIYTFFNTIKPQLPSTVKIQVPNSGAVMDQTTGEITGSWTGGSHSLITGGAAGKYHAAAGACVTWTTATFVHGRRLKGRTFLVPLESGCFAPDGSLDDGTRTILQGAVDALVTAGTDHFVIWHRPTTTGGSDGLTADVLSGSIRDRGAVLTSRRPA